MHLYHYVSLGETVSDKYRQRLIAERRIFFSDPSTFDDVLDSNIPGWETAKAMLFDCRVFCLSMQDRDDAQMFKRYGDNHKGIRLKFTVNPNLPCGECTPLAMGRAVEYVDELPPCDKTRSHMYYYYKLRSRWGFQKEYRVLMKTDHDYYSKSELTEIALGFQFNMDYLPILIQWVKDGGHTRVTFKKAVNGNSVDEYKYEVLPV